MIAGLFDLQKEFGAGDFSPAEKGQMPGVLLAIDQADAVVAAQCDQGRERDLGGIGGMGKHGFAKHRPAECHAVQPADQFAMDPGLDAVGMACCMEPGIGLDHLRHDPGSRLALTLFGGARGDDLSERVVHADFAVRLGAEGLQRLAQRAVQPKLGDRQRHARVWRPPQDGLPGAIPGEGALRVCGAQVRYVQCASGSQQAGCGIFRPPGQSGSGEWVFDFQPGQLRGHGGRTQRHHCLACGPVCRLVPQRAKK